MEIFTRSGIVALPQLRMITVQATVQFLTVFTRGCNSTGRHCAALKAFIKSRRPTNICYLFQEIKYHILTHTKIKSQIRSKCGGKEKKSTQ